MKNKKLYDLYQQLSSIDKNDFRSKMIQRLFPEVEEASKHVNSRLDSYYESRFENKGF